MFEGKVLNSTLLLVPPPQADTTNENKNAKKRNLIIFIQTKIYFFHIYKSINYD